MSNSISPENFMLSPDQLKWCCDLESYDYLKTGIIPRITGTVGQKRALNAIDLGLEIEAPGYNIFVTGFPGSGRSYTIKTILSHIDKRIAPAKDCCYVNNFKDASRPKLIELESGKGKILKQEMKAFIEQVQTRLNTIFEEEKFRIERDEIADKFQKREKTLFTQFELRVKKEGLAIVYIQRGSVQTPEIFPVVDEKPVPLDTLEVGEHKDKYNEEELKEIVDKIDEFKLEMNKLLQEGRRLAKEMMREIKVLEQYVARNVIEDLIQNVQEEFVGNLRVKKYLDDVIKHMLDNLENFRKEDIEKNPMQMLQKQHSSLREYEVNIVIDTAEIDEPPIIIEKNPTFTNLFGTVEREFERSGAVITDFTKIKAGSLLRADGGFLVLNVRDIIAEPGVWRNLVRTLKNRELEIQTLESSLMLAPSVIKPEPIPIYLKVILLGDERYYQLLNYYDEDFLKIFKIKAEFDSTTSISKGHLKEFAAVLDNLIREEKMQNFTPDGYAAIIEESVRFAGRRNKISTRFGEIADLVREANHWAKEFEKDKIDSDAVQKAITEREERHRLVDEKYQEMLLEEVLLVSTDGKRVGQINGLAVFGIAHYFGKPSRITASAGVGRAGIINIERESRLSGSIHDKGVLILSGFLRDKYAQNMPLALSASLTFEQNYGGVDGDSATIAETVCLLSAIAQIPIRQDLAVTGSMNQKGDAQAIGGVNQKIEGFFGLCRDREFTGTQGVVIPVSNVEDLMLRQDVIDAANQENFKVYSVSNIDEAIEIFFGIPAGIVDEETGNYPEGSVHRAIQDRLRKLLDSGNAEPSIINVLENKGPIKSDIPEPPQDPPPPGVK
ncbi:MAG: AAA family ATPase [Planctomycetes bacterium]|nr:AAA family ATPase [Planctomycetota bacterium]